jgi:large conductance mechanosensitive channel
MLKKFQDFAVKGNAFDLAVGVIIGAAFGAIVSSLVGDIFMPLVGAVTGGLDFSNYFLPLSGKVTAATLVEAKKQGAVLAWGDFLTIVINFAIVAGVMFGLVSLIQRVRQKEEAKPAAAPPRQEVLLAEIRDLLAKR